MATQVLKPFKKHVEFSVKTLKVQRDSDENFNGIIVVRDEESGQFFMIGGGKHCASVVLMKEEEVQEGIYTVSWDNTLYFRSELPDHLEKGVKNILSKGIKAVKTSGKPMVNAIPSRGIFAALVMLNFSSGGINTFKVAVAPCESNIDLDKSSAFEIVKRDQIEIAMRYCVLRIRSYEQMLVIGGHECFFVAMRMNPTSDRDDVIRLHKEADKFLS